MGILCINLHGGHNFADMVTKYLPDNQTILVEVQIFGLML